MTIEICCIKVETLALQPSLSASLTTWISVEQTGPKTLPMLVTIVNISTLGVS